MKKAIVFLFDKVEEMEAIAPIDILRRGGIAVTTAGINGKKSVCGRSGVRMEADALLEDLDIGAFDIAVLPGGPGTYANLENAPLLEAIGKLNADGKIVAAICAAPVILKKAGVLDGKTYTAYPDTLPEVDAVLQTKPVVVSGNVITSRGAGTATEFALSILEKSAGSDAAKEVANSVCFMR